MSEKVIWKEELEPSFNPQYVQMSKGAEALSIQAQRQKLCMWYLCDPDAEKEERKFVVVCTGHQQEWKGERTFIGTAQIDGLVLHIFEIDRPPVYVLEQT